MKKNGILRGYAKNFPPTAGFTLIETLLYSALFSMVIGFSIIIFYQVLSSESQNRARREVETEADFLMRKITWALSSAQSVSQPAVGATSSVLTLNKYGFSQNPLTFDAYSGTARLSRAAGTPVSLTNGSVTVSQLLFSHFPPSGSQTEAVRISISIVASTSENIRKASTTLQNTIYLP
ncbi:MAG: hypothetical protein AAB536_01305 [Patescibacteria group bacterium]